MKLYIVYILTKSTYYSYYNIIYIYYYNYNTKYVNFIVHWHFNLFHTHMIDDIMYNSKYRYIL